MALCAADMKKKDNENARGAAAMKTENENVRKGATIELDDQDYKEVMKNKHKLKDNARLKHLFINDFNSKQEREIIRKLAIKMSCKTLFRKLYSHQVLVNIFTIYPV